MENTTNENVVCETTKELTPVEGLKLALKEYEKLSKQHDKKMEELDNIELKMCEYKEEIDKFNNML